MCECCDTYGINRDGIPHLYKRWKYSSCDKAIYLTRDYDTGISYMVFNAENDSGYDLDASSWSCIKLEIHNCPICGRNLDDDVPEGFIEQKKKELERLRKELEEKEERELKEKRYKYYLQLKEEFGNESFTM